MSAIYRSLLSNSCLRKATCSKPFGNILVNQSRAVVLRAAPAVVDKKEDYFAKNERLGRPMSPHLTIYKPQITSMLSITHRITGMAVSGYVYAFSIGMMMLPASFPHYCAALANMHLSPALLFTAKFLIAFPFTYHLCNGVRHLMWDLGKGLELKQVYSTGYTMLGAATILSLVLLML
ncbi:hypothetical protein B566_EDAN000837 [Ephemera danica]|nr:hypothetical protein B566_EDAN000837 [Ephemera danica]